MPEPILTISHPSFPSFDLILVEGGEFLMGDDRSEYASKKPAHNVKVSSFYMAKYQVTQALWQAVMGKNPSRFQGENRPVESVSWLDAQEFIKKLNALLANGIGASEGVTHSHALTMLRLPTEAEWEYAARGGIYSQGYTYAGSDKLKQVGWYDENANEETHDVGLLLGNELGIHDLSGNVWEWCEDWFDEKYYELCLRQGLVENPRGPDKGGYRVLRGGGYFSGAVDCRPADRYRRGPVSRNDYIGFRLCLPLQSVG